MNKLELISKKLMLARKERNKVHSSFYSTFKGEVTTKLSSTNPGDEYLNKTDDEKIEILAKKWKKNLTNNISETSEEELKLLQEFLPHMLNKDQLTNIVAQVLRTNSNIVTDYLDGSTHLIGILIGLVMKVTNAKADAKLVKEILLELLNK